MRAHHFARPDSDASERLPQEGALTGGDGQPASAATAVVSSQSVDSIRQAYETWAADYQPEGSRLDLWVAFLTGYLRALATLDAELTAITHAPELDCDRGCHGDPDLHRALCEDR